MNRWYIAAAVLGCIGFVLTVVISIVGWAVVPGVIDNAIIEEAQLVDGSEIYDKWSNIDIPIYIKFYIFSVTNPDEFEIGEKPQVEEIGPYVFSQKRTKRNIDREVPGRIRYRQNIAYFFEPSMSVTSDGRQLDLSDKINIPNIPLYTVVKQLGCQIRNILFPDQTAVLKGITVGELTFDGFWWPTEPPTPPPENFVTEDGNEYSYEEVIDKIHKLGPWSKAMNDQTPGFPIKVGIYLGKNDTDDGLYEVDDGTIGKSENFGQVYSWEGKSVLGYWIENSTCDRIQGTDGTVFPPFLDTSDNIVIFVTDICRPISLSYIGDIDYEGIDGYSYSAPKEVLEDPRINPDNRCYCNEEDVNDCFLAGVINLETCQDDAPIAMSAPHFLDGDEKYSQYFNLKPDRNIHQTQINLEKKTAVLLSAQKRIQINLDAKLYPCIVAPQEDLVFPLLWAEEIASLDDESVDDVKSSLNLIKAVNIIRIVFLCIGIISMILAVFAYVKGKKSRTFV